MNPVQTQILIENAINDRPNSADGKYHLCFWEDKVQCCVRSHTRERHEIFHPISPTEMRDGFSASEWRLLGEKVHSYLEGRAQTQILIKNAINDRPNTADGKYHLCFWEDKVQCCVRSHTRERHKIFHPISPTEMRDGFAASKWRLLGGKVHIYLEGLNKCHTCQKLLQTENEKG